jgi:hypothetical protein
MLREEAESTNFLGVMHRARTLLCKNVHSRGAIKIRMSNSELFYKICTFNFLSSSEQAPHGLFPSLRAHHRLLKNSMP